MDPLNRYPQVIIRSSPTPAQRELTAEELERSESGPAFAEVKAEQLFSASADYVLAARVLRLNPRRYRELKAGWDFANGRPRRDPAFYD
jgi:hypothetical protein